MHVHLIGGRVARASNDPVINNEEERLIVGFVHEKDAMMAYNNALLELQSEERGDAPPKLF